VSNGTTTIAQRRDPIHFDIETFDSFDPTQPSRLLCARLLAESEDTLSDLAVLRLILSLSTTRRNVMELSIRLLGEFGGLAGAIHAEPKRLLAIEGMTATAASLLKATHAVAIRLTREAIMNAPILGSWKQVLNYCRTTLAHKAVEELHLLLLNSKNHLIADRCVQKGTVDFVPVLPREVAKCALEGNATAVIMVHNHPSGDSTPSRGDIEMTHAVDSILKSLDISLYDHLVIGKGSHASLKSMGLF